MNNCNGEDQLHNIFTIYILQKNSECQIKPLERKIKICLEKFFFQLVQNFLVQVSVVWHCRDKK